MALHFTRDEFAARRRRACEEITKAGLNGLLIFRQENMYWLTGYDTTDKLLAHSRLPLTWDEQRSVLGFA